MNRYHQKIVQYAHGLERVNELVLRTLAIKEPETFLFDPNSATLPKPDQLMQLDPADPETYRTYCHFPPPLPLDKLIVLNEVQSLLSLGLQSKEGALRDLGEEFPESKLQEIRQELIDDALAEGSLNLIKTEIQNEIMSLTGMSVDAGGNAMPAAPEQVAMAQQGAAQTPILDPAIIENLRLGEAKVRTRLVTEAYGTRLPQRQVPQDYQK
jgi:hypothetical protein